MNPSLLHVNLGLRSYDIAISQSDAASVAAFARQRAQGRLAVVVADENVEHQAAAVYEALATVGFQAAAIVIPPGEQQKSLERASLLYDRLAELGADRKTLIVALGGGVIGDLAGFVAATFARGLPLLMVPTTLLAMVDSSVGGKVAINHPRGKNLIGAFHQPIGVWIDLSMLDTLGDREYRSGLAEVVKYGVALDAEFFAYVEAHADHLLDHQPETLRHVIARCCRLKADIVERDERDESGVRAALNYGHTFAHALESAAGYGTWLHGEAVAFGMSCAARLGQRCGLLPAHSELPMRQDRLLTRFGLPTRVSDVPIDSLIAAMSSDKKVEAGGLRFVMPKELGCVELVGGIPEADVRQVLRKQTAAQETKPLA